MVELSLKSDAMRVVFAGTPDFAQVAIARIHAAGYEIPLVLTQPDRPAGRGLAMHASSVKQWAESKGIAVVQPRSLRLDGKYADDAAAARLALEAAQADVMVVAAYGLILPQWVLDLMSAGEFSAGPPQGKSAPEGLEPAAPSLPEQVWTGDRGEASREPRPARPRALHEVKSVGARGLGCLNIHASLLPRWRGAAPIHRAIEAGDAETGVTIMQMDAGLDTGDMLLTSRLPIADDDTTGSLHDKLAELGGQLIVEALSRAGRGALQPVSQPHTGVTYAHKIVKAEAEIDWSQPAEVIGRRIRAFDPAPGAVSTIGSDVVKLWRYQISSYSRPDSLGKGTILLINEAGITVSCGEGTICLTELQRAGGKRLPAADFVRGFPLAPGMVFGASH